MKKQFLLSVLLFVFTFSFGQKNINKQIENTKKELSQKSCECISNINDTNRPKQEILDDISKCIEENIGALQIANQLIGLNLDEIVDATTKGTDTVISGGKDIIIALDEKSDTYKKYYYELEKELLESCKELKQLAAGENEESKFSSSYNEKAITYYKKGSKENENNNIKKAAKYFKKAVKADPNFAFAWDNLGLMYRKLKKYDNAITAYNQSLKIDPTGPMPLQNLAVVYTYQKKYQKAIEAFKQLSKYDKDNPEIYYGIGQIQYQYLKEYENSLDNMCKAYNLYVEQKSPYRSDAEKIINYIGQIMTKDGKESFFYEILEKHNIRPETN